MDTPKGLVVDHKNHLKWDNRKENLRLVSPAQNAMNRSKYTNTSTGYIGVRKRISKHGRIFYSTSLRVNEHDRFIAQGQDIEELAKLRDYVAWSFRGEYAVLNFPDIDYSTFENPRLEKIKEKIKNW